MLVVTWDCIMARQVFCYVWFSTSVSVQHICCVLRVCISVVIASTFSGSTLVMVRCSIGWNTKQCYSSAELSCMFRCHTAPLGTSKCIQHAYMRREAWELYSWWWGGGFTHSAARPYGSASCFVIADVPHWLVLASLLLPPPLNYCGPLCPSLLLRNFLFDFIGSTARVSSLIWSGRARLFEPPCRHCYCEDSRPLAPAQSTTGVSNKYCVYTDHATSKWHSCIYCLVQSRLRR